MDNKIDFYFYTINLITYQLSHHTILYIILSLFVIYYGIIIVIIWKKHKYYFVQFIGHKRISIQSAVMNLLVFQQ